MGASPPKLAGARGTGWRAPHPANHQRVRRSAVAAARGCHWLAVLALDLRRPSAPTSNRLGRFPPARVLIRLACGRPEGRLAWIRRQQLGVPDQEHAQAQRGAGGLDAAGDWSYRRQPPRTAVQETAGTSAHDGTVGRPGRARSRFRPSRIRASQRTSLALGGTRYTRSGSSVSCGRGSGVGCGDDQ